MKIRAFLLLLISTAISSGTFFFPVLAATNQGRLWSSGFENNTLTAEVEVGSSGGAGTEAIVTSPVHSGTYALQTTSVASGASWARYQFVETNANGPYYFRAYIRAADYPDTTEDVVVLESTGGTSRVGVRMTNAGKLQLFDLDGTVAQIGSNSSALSLNTWYRLELKYDATAGLSAVAVEARLDGTTFASSSAVTNGASIGAIVWGVVTAALNYNLYWDDIAINTAGWAGEGNIVHLRPNAAGDNAQWTIGAGTGSNFEQVDEVTPDDATTYLSEITATGLVTDDYNLSAATGAVPSGSTISVAQVGIRGGGTGTTARTYVARVKASSGGTVEESTSISWAFNGWQTNQVVANAHNYVFTLYDLPGAPTSDWTISDLDSAQIGVRHDALSVNEVRLSTIWLLVDYVPGATKFVVLDPADSTVGTATTVTVQAQRADNTVDTNYQSDVTLAASGSATGGGLVSIANGVGTRSVNDTVAETVTLSLTDSQGTGLDVTSTQQVNFTNPVPTTTAISPSAKQVGSAGFSMTVTGTNFVTNSVGRFNGSDRVTTFTSSTQLSLQVLTSDLTATGTFPVTVFNAAPGGGTSNSQLFSVTDGPPPGAAKFVILDPTDSNAGTAVTVTVQAQRSDNTVDTDFQADVTLAASGSATGEGLVDIVNGQGTRQVNDTAAETVTLSLSDTEGTGLDVSSTQQVAFAEVQSGVVEGGNVPPPTSAFKLAGRAYPGAQLTVIIQELGPNQTPVKQDIVADSGGSFEIEFGEVLRGGLTTYGLVIADKDGRIAQTKLFNLGILKAGTESKTIFAAPTVGFAGPAAATKGDFVGFIGYATPDSSLELEVDGTALAKKEAVGADGRYKVLMNTAELAFGPHRVRARQIDAQGVASDFSAQKTFIVSQLPVPRADLNADGIISISDWSIFLSRWRTKDPDLRATLDLNGDGKVDISDFSVFVRTIRR